GTFFGMDLSHDRFHLARAVMEGVAFQIVWKMERFPPPNSEQGIILAGGASKSPLWGQLLADIAQIPVRIPEVADLACVGAAVIAGVGSGVFQDCQEGCSRMLVGERVIRLDPRESDFRAWLEKYKRIAQKLGDAYAI